MDTSVGEGPGSFRGRAGPWSFVFLISYFFSIIIMARAGLGRGAGVVRETVMGRRCQGPLWIKRREGAAGRFWHAGIGMGKGWGGIERVRDVMGRSNNRSNHNNNNNNRNNRRIISQRVMSISTGDGGTSSLPTRGPRRSRAGAATPTPPAALRASYGWRNIQKAGKGTFPCTFPTTSSSLRSLAVAVRRCCGAVQGSKAGLRIVMGLMMGQDETREGEVRVKWAGCNTRTIVGEKEKSSNRSWGRAARKAKNSGIFPSLRLCLFFLIVVDYAWPCTYA